jgi:hypothetical protein
VFGVKKKDEKFTLELTAAFEELLEEYLDSQIGLPTINNFLLKEEPIKFDEKTEQKSISDFLSRPCPCKQNCQKQFSEEEVFNARASFRMLTRDEQNCFILGQLRSCIRFTDIARSGRYETVRERKKYDYRISADRPVCREVFLFYHGETSKRLRRLQQHLAQSGFVPVVHGNTGRKPIHACPSGDREVIKTFILNYAAAHGLPDPGRDIRRGKGRLRILLPTVMNYLSVYHIYERSMNSQAAKPLGYKSFIRIWREEVPYVEFNDPRTDLCMTCEEFKKKINQVSVQLDEEREEKKAQVYQEALAHILDAKTERAYYRAAAQVAHSHYNKFSKRRVSSQVPPNSQEILMHYSWDFAQQLQYPYEDQQVGPIYFKTPRRAQIFGVCNEGIPCQVNYLIDEADFMEKDANTVISLLDHFFTHHGLGEKYIHLTADNCVGQNKNNAVLQYLLYRVLAGQHTRIEMSFLIVGHTKFSPDGYFGLIRRRYRRSRVYTYDQLVSVIENSSSAGHNLCQRYDGHDKVELNITYRDWSGWLKKLFRKLPNITSYHHFKIDNEIPGLIRVKKRVNSPETDHQLLLKRFRTDWQELLRTTPEVIRPPGLTAEREWYLYDQIRCHIPDENARDLTCPKPRGKRP